MKTNTKLFTSNYPGRSRSDLEKLVEQIDIKQSRHFNRQIISKIINPHPTKVDNNKTINKQAKNSTRIVNNPPADKLDIESKELDKKLRDSYKTIFKEIKALREETRRFGL